MRGGVDRASGRGRVTYIVVLLCRQRAEFVADQNSSGDALRFKPRRARVLGQKALRLRNRYVPQAQKNPALLPECGVDTRSDLRYSFGQQSNKT